MDLKEVESGDLKAHENRKIDRKLPQMKAGNDSFKANVK
jgi:hypothetical protein